MERLLEQLTDALNRVSEKLEDITSERNEYKREVVRLDTLLQQDMDGWVATQWVKRHKDGTVTHWPCARSPYSEQHD